MIKLPLWHSSFVICNSNGYVCWYKFVINSCIDAALCTLTCKLQSSCNCFEKFVEILFSFDQLKVQNIVVYHKHVLLTFDSVDFKIYRICCFFHTKSHIRSIFLTKNSNYWNNLLNKYIPIRTFFILFFKNQLMQFIFACRALEQFFYSSIPPLRQLELDLNKKEIDS